MAILKRQTSKGSLKVIINYVLNKEKTEDRIITGKDCSFQNTITEMNATKNLYGKTKGITYHHIIQSFKPGEVSPEKAHTIGVEFAENKFKGFEVLIATHKDKNHIHNHLIVNSVSFKDGHKLVSDKKSLHELKRENNRICKREHLSTIEKPYAKKRYSLAEYRLAEKGLSVWKEQLRSAIDEAKERSKNMVELRQYLEKNFGIKMKIQNKTVSYLHPKKQKYCRADKLGFSYTKEGLNRFFEREKDFIKISHPFKEKSLSFNNILSGFEKITQKIARDIEKEALRAQQRKKLTLYVPKEKQKQKSAYRER